MRNRPKADTCRAWPECTCGDRWAFYQDVPALDFESAGPVLHATLACVAHRCPDLRARQHATVQLLHPVWRDVERLQ